MIGVALAALIIRWPLVGFPAALTLAPVAAALSGRARLARDTALVLACAYVPYAPGFFIPCDHCREAWAQLFTIAPGGFLLELARVAIPPLRDLLPSHFEAPVAYLASGVATVLLLASVVALARRGSAWKAAAAVAVLAYSSVVSWCFYAAIRS